MNLSIDVYYVPNVWHKKHRNSLSPATEGISRVTPAEARKMVTRLSHGEFNTLRFERRK